MLTGNQLRSLRAINGMSQAALAVAANVAPATIANFEVGKSELKTESLSRILAALGVSITYTADDAEVTLPAHPPASSSESTSTG